MTATNPSRSWRTFLLMWCGQMISLLGSSLTSFALGVWVFRATGSLTQFALISFFATMPGILFMPVAGTLVDRLDRRRLMIACDTGGLVITLILILLYTGGGLAIWQIYLTSAIVSLLSALRIPAYQTAVTALVARESLGRASGMSQVSLALALVLSPVLATVLLDQILLGGVLAVDLASYAAPILIMALLVRLPARTPEERARKRASLMRESAEGWHYIRTRPGLMALLGLSAAVNVVTGIVEVLLTPLVLSFASNRELGAVLSIGGLGMLISSALCGLWGVPRRRVVGVLVPALVQGLLLLLAGLGPSIPLMAAAVFLYLACAPVMLSSDQVIWQHKVPLEIQGRVFAIRRMVAVGSVPLTFVVAGPLADYLFEPLLRPGGPLAGTVGRLIGVGPGRGIALLFILMGLLLAGLALLAALYPRLRHVERDLPDALPAGPPEADVAPGPSSRATGVGG